MSRLYDIITVGILMTFVASGILVFVFNRESIVVPLSILAGFAAMGLAWWRESP